MAGAIIHPPLLRPGSGLGALLGFFYSQPALLRLSLNPPMETPAPARGLGMPKDGGTRHREGPGTALSEPVPAA